MRNEVVNLMKVTPEELEQRTVEVVRSRCGEEVEVLVQLLGLSPCCKTFSKTDSSNQSRGHHYRDHRHPHRPPKDRTSVKGS